jgi:hypothetical protein
MDPSSDYSQYERERDENIKRNQAVLEQLGIIPIVPIASETKKKRRNETKEHESQPLKNRSHLRRVGTSSVVDFDSLGTELDKCDKLIKKQRVQRQKKPIRHFEQEEFYDSMFERVRHKDCTLVKGKTKEVTTFKFECDEEDVVLPPTDCTLNYQKYHLAGFDWNDLRKAQFPEENVRLFMEYTWKHIMHRYRRVQEYCQKHFLTEEAARDELYAIAKTLHDLEQAEIAVHSAAMNQEGLERNLFMSDQDFANASLKVGHTLYLSNRTLETIQTEMEKFDKYLVELYSKEQSMFAARPTQPLAIFQNKQQYFKDMSPLITCTCGGRFALKFGFGKVTVRNHSCSSDTACSLRVM